mmetsp:Transcript_7054/g.25092  ORF Transcript_7054/g.25092 Transcript_7054/m.25092 type:complete len:243 (-) Transcript_7054:1488-2216(-)
MSSSSPGMIATVAEMFCTTPSASAIHASSTVVSGSALMRSMMQSMSSTTRPRSVSEVITSRKPPMKPASASEPSPTAKSAAGSTAPSIISARPSGARVMAFIASVSATLDLKCASAMMPKMLARKSHRYKRVVTRQHFEYAIEPSAWRSKPQMPPPFVGQRRQQPPPLPREQEQQHQHSRQQHSRKPHRGSEMATTKARPAHMPMLSPYATGSLSDLGPPARSRSPVETNSADPSSPVRTMS